jgi:hypothetical protein
MIWQLEEISNAISGVDPDGSDLIGYKLALWDPEKRIGVGHNSFGEQVLILPGQSDLLSFEKKYADFSPWAKAIWAEEEKSIGRVAILRCKFDSGDQIHMRAVAGIFRGLLEINERYGTAGLAIWSLKKLFEEGLLEATTQGVTGLMGELLVLLNAPDREAAIKAWHSKTDAAYDFSWENFRLEVKTTKGPVREHNFSSNQIPGPNGIQLQVASVKLITTEIGQTLGELVNIVTAGLPEELTTKVLDQCNKTLGVPPFAVTEPIIDVTSSLANIAYFAGSTVPMPPLTTDVLSMKWEATLENTNPVSAVHPTAQN